MRFLCRDQNTGSRAILRDGAGHLRMALATAWLVALLVAGQTALAADPAWQVQSVDGTGTVTRADGVRLALEPGAVLGGGGRRVRRATPRFDASGRRQRGHRCHRRICEREARAATRTGSPPWRRGRETPSVADAKAG